MSILVIFVVFLSLIPELRMPSIRFVSKILNFCVDQW